MAWLLWAANRKAEKMDPEKKSDFGAENDSKYSYDERILFLPLKNLNYLLNSDNHVRYD